MHWGDIDDTSIDFPMEVSDMAQATLTFTVPIEPARTLVPGSAFEVLEVAAGSAMFLMALVDYVENPWGDYNEVNLGLLCAPVGQPERAGAFVYRMPVDQDFTMKAGNAVLGLPKTVEDLGFEYPDGQVQVRLGDDELVVSLPRVDADEPPVETQAVTYSYLDGVATELPLTIEMGSAVIDPADVRITLGQGEIADELRSIGLPRRPDMAVWGEDLTGTFGAPRPV